MDTSQSIQDILKRLEILSKRQSSLQSDILAMKSEVIELKAELENITTDEITLEELEKQATEEQPIESFPIEIPKIKAPLEVFKSEAPPQYEAPKQPIFNIEKFIGENLASKIGIIITVLGVAIGVKYAIDHELISPLARVILGYLVGIGLFGISIKLREKYTDFSAVLLSGALATMYFVTYAAYSFYGLIPQSVTFGLMVIFTIFTVVAALSYDLQMIAIGGLVGAYMVPFLLSTGEDKPVTLFTYMTIINIGILFISFKKYWKLLYYLAFSVTWLIFIGWSVGTFVPEKTVVGLAFSTIFFVIFYATFLAYKFVKNEEFSRGQVILLMLNSVIFYGLGYGFLNDTTTGRDFLGLFTLLNAVVHFTVSLVIYKRELADRNLFFLVSGLVLVFLTMAIPVQLDGNWVTILWAGEMVLLFWIGRTQSVPTYEKLSYPLWVLTTFSLLDDWTNGYHWFQVYGRENVLIPIFNIYFLTTAIVITAFGVVYKIHSNEQFHTPSIGYFKRNMSTFLSTIIVVLLYFMFHNEIESYFNNAFTASYLPLSNGDDYVQDNDILRFKLVWLINYGLFFIGILSIFNLKKIKNIDLARVISIFILIGISVFLTVGLYTLGELKNSYLYHEQGEYFSRGIGNLTIRYLSYGLVTLLLYLLNENKKAFFKDNKYLDVRFDIILNVIILWVISSEMVHWLELNGYTQAYKWAISILFGTYALCLIGYGIRSKKKHLRLAAIVLFALTLVKLFLFDLVGLDTIAKTVVMISLGILLLIISFLYNKFKDRLFNDDED